MRKIQLLLLFNFLMVCSSSAQSMVTYYDGTPAMEIKHKDVEGTELLYSEWTVGSVTTSNGKLVKGIRLKYNVLDDLLYFQGNNEQSMLFTTPILAFSIGDSLSGQIKTFRKSYPSIGKLTGQSFYEVLVDATLPLLKKTSKNIIETKEYSSPVVKKQIIDDVQYYVYRNGEMFLVKKDKTSIKNLFQGKEAIIEKFIADNKLNLKKENDLVSLFKHLNSL